MKLASASMRPEVLAPLASPPMRDFPGPIRVHRRAAVRVTVLGVVGASALLATPAGSTPVRSGLVTTVSHTTLPTTKSTLRWSACSNNKAVECANLVVPRDPAKPAGSMVTVAVARMKATDSKNRIGTLLVNPGGPGASGRTFAFQLASAVALSPLRERFDIVGWDPRGVGATTPVTCFGTGAEYDRLYADDPTPDDAAELEKLKADTKAFATSCGTREGDLLRYTSTDVVVADMERLRVALGEDTISYLGFSYGTYLGAKYADRYPTRVRAFVLDGALDPTADADVRVRMQAAGFELALAGFLDSCKNGGCGFVHDGETPSQAFDRLMAAIDAKPIKVGDRTVGPGEASTAALAGLYNNTTGWTILRGALTRADKDDGKGLLGLFDQYADRQGDGTYLNTADANAATNCTDVPASRDPAHYDALAKELTSSSPRFGAFAAYSTLVCAYWPVPVTGSLAPVRATGSAPILVIGTVDDPATPYVWAQSLAKQLANGVLLTYQGEGHTAFLTGNRCIRNAGEAYLLDRIVPKAGTRCPVE